MDLTVLKEFYKYEYEQALENDDGRILYGPASYDGIIASISNKTPLVKVSANDYQGDTWVLLEHPTKEGSIGYLCISWGSCSGCDALQGCESWNDIILLAEQIESQARWFDTAKDALTWFETHDWKLDSAWHIDDLKKFIECSKHVLREMQI